MREIKFRAWNKEKSIMCYDNEDNSKEYFDGINSTEIGFINHRLSIPKDDGVWYFRSRYDVMQYTGLKDKNGKEIYEGDIVKIGEYLTYEVSINDFTQMHVIDNEMGMEELWKNHKVCKIIGNIYENPELLKGTV